VSGGALRFRRFDVRLRFASPRRAASVEVMREPTLSDVAQRLDSEATELFLASSGDAG
jgi:hypothetical protein